jgi:hypothetical protein
MGTFAQFSFICMTIIGFVLTHFWLRMHSLPALPDAKHARNWFFAALILAILFFLIVMFIYNFVPSRQLPRWLTSPILLTGLLGLLAGLVARLSITHLGDWRETVVYGIPALVLFLVGLFSADLATLIRRLTAIQTQHLTVTFSPPSDTKQPLVIDTGGSKPFEGDTPFSIGVANLYNTLGAMGRDLEMINRCIVDSPAAATGGGCFPSARTMGTSDIEAALKLKEYLSQVSELKQTESIASCLNDYSATYPNGLPIQDDLYNLSSDLVRSVMQSQQCGLPDEKMIKTRVESLQPYLSSYAAEYGDLTLGRDRLLLEKLEEKDDNDLLDERIVGFLGFRDTIGFLRLRAEQRRQTRSSFDGMMRELQSEQLAIHDHQVVMGATRLR